MSGIQPGRAQVGIVGAGPAGLLLSHLLALRGVDSVLVENRSRAYCEARQRAGVLEAGSVDILREAGLAARLDREGLEHGGIYLQFAGQRRHVDFRALCGRTVTVYAQTEVVKDLIAARLAAGARIEFEVSDTGVAEVTTDRPVWHTASDGTAQVTCDAIAGCDGFHGISRDVVAAGHTVWETACPYAWLGILASAAVHRRADLQPSPDGRPAQPAHSGHQQAVPAVAPDEDIAQWPDGGFSCSAGSRCPAS
jgi:p-hydroxybenzoate 3-monooxygenase